MNDKNTTPTAITGTDSRSGNATIQRTYNTLGKTTNKNARYQATASIQTTPVLGELTKHRRKGNETTGYTWWHT